MKAIRIVIFLLLMTVLAACGQSKGEVSGSAENPANSSAAATISKDEYNQIKNGMSYQEIIEIIGGEGDKLSESGEEGDDIYVFVVMYEGETPGSNASFVFSGNKLHTKSQYGLK